MPTPHQPTPSANGAGHANLFVEADPDLQALARPKRAVSSSAAGSSSPRRARGRIVAVDSPSPPIAVASVRCPDVARFTRPNTRLGSVRAIAQQRVRRADTNAGRLLGRVAARPYGALVTLALIGAMLLALSWLGLALRDTAAARRTAVRSEAAAAAALNGDRVRIKTLSAQLSRAALAAQHQPAATTTAARPPAPHSASKPSHANRGRH